MARAASSATPAGLTTTPDAGPAAAPARRRVRALPLALAGAAVAVAYAMLHLKLRLGPPLVMVGLGGLTLVFSAVALWRVIDPLSRHEGPAAAAPRAPQRVRELDREKQLVLKAIKEIELDYQMRKIAEVDYREMIERYRARAMRLISEIEAGDNYRELIERELRDRLAVLEARGAAAKADAAPEVAQEAAAPAAAGAARACPGCGTGNDQDAQFCKKCGAKIVV